MEMPGSSHAGDAFVGVDVGGTHTDIQVVMGGKTSRGKALTTYHDFSVGVLEAIGVAANRLGLSLDEFLPRCQLIVNATTVVTNAVTQLKGAKVGVLVTAGFRDEFRFAGCSRIAAFDDQLQVNAPDLVRRSDIIEIVERCDSAGNVLIPLDTSAVERAVRQLVEKSGVESIAICFLSSYANPSHELEAAAIIRRMYPSLFLTASSQVSSVLGENRRWTTAMLNCFVHKQANVFLDGLDTNLRSAGLSGSLSFFQGLGGGISKDRAKQFPLALLGAGPAGGAVGANELAKRMGVQNVLLGDMGGTSFDTGIIVNNEVRTNSSIDLGLFRTALSLVDVISVGAGGGSIAWISERGVPQVGPQSAGSTPGPACYGRGGKKPTVTDAMVAMGIIDPTNYLGGRVQLRKDLAAAAIREEFADPADWDLDTACAAIHDLVTTNMSHAVREVSVNKGHDPRDFLFLAYGGTLPMFGMQIARTLGMSQVVVPRDSPVFCAWGLLMSDYVMRFDQTVNWNLSNVQDLPRVNALSRRLTDAGIAAMQSEGFGSSVTVIKSGDMQFSGQVHALPIELGEGDLVASGIPELSTQFLGVYERTYGSGTAWRDMPLRLVNYSVTLRGQMPTPTIDRQAADPRDPKTMLKSVREVFLPDLRQRQEINIYDDAKFTVGSTITGPAIIEAVDTTIYVPLGASATRDEFTNIVLTDASGGLQS